MTCALHERRHAKLHLARLESREQVVNSEVLGLHSQAQRFTQHHIEMMDPVLLSARDGDGCGSDFLEFDASSQGCPRAGHITEDSDAVTHMRKLGSGGIKEAKEMPKLCPSSKPSGELEPTCQDGTSEVTIEEVTATWGSCSRGESQSGEARKYLGRFGLHGDLALQPVKPGSEDPFLCQRTCGPKCFQFATGS